MDGETGAPARARELLGALSARLRALRAVPFGPRVKALAARAGAEARAASKLAAEARAFVAPRLPGFVHATWARHFGRRLPAVALLGALAAEARLASTGPAPKTREGVAAMLSEASGGEVGPDDFVWEKSEGALPDLALGRRLVFLAARPEDGGRADLFRARARLSRAGLPLGVTALENLSESPLGDERDLEVRGGRAAYLVRVDGLPEAVVALELEAPAKSFPARLAARLADPFGLRPTGARVEVRFAAPPPELAFELQGDRLVLALGEERTPAAVPLAGGGPSLVTGKGPNFGIRAHRFEAPGEAGLGRVATKALGEKAETRLAFLASRAAGALDGKRALPSGPPASWPGSPFSVSETKAGGATFRAVAIDLARVWPSLEPGRQRPRSPFGASSPGEIPPGAVAVFSAGAPSPRHGGFVDGGRVFAAPSLGLPTLRLEGEGIEASLALGPLREVPAAGSAWSLLQASEGACPGCREARSALCLAPGGGLVYLWGREARRADLEAASSRLRCERLVPLATGGEALGFARLSPDGAPLPADPAMPIGRPSGLDALGEGDFVALFPLQAAPTAPLPKGVSWAPDGGEQPSPVELPAAHEAEVELQGARVRLSAFLPGRFGLALEPGSEELRAKSGFGPLRKRPARVLAAIGLGASHRRAVRGLSVGGEVGLPFHDRALVLLVDPAPGGRARLEPSDGFLPPADADATELPIVAEDGKLRLAARRPAERRRRGALCVLDDGTLLVATSTYDTDEPNAQALLDAGCARVAGLERGEKRDAFVARAGKGEGIADRYGSTSLLLFEAPSPPRAREL